jgi:transposase InsO family protein
MKRDRALQLVGISKHMYYYTPKSGRRGRKPSTHTEMLLVDGSSEQVSNQSVVERIIDIKLNPETDYGAKTMTKALMLLGLIINHKKVFRLMEHYQLLHERNPRTPRKYVQYRRLDPSQPLEALEMDIKLQWVERHCCYAYILTVIDCFTRKVLHWSVAYSIKHHQVIKAWEEIITEYLQPHDMLKKKIAIEVRNDNDTRFAAKKVQQYMADNFLNQTFTHPYTPEENGHVESFHAILGRSLERQQYAGIKELEAHLKSFYRTYNRIRLHTSLDRLSPDMFWKVWGQGLIESTKRKRKPMKHKLKIPHYQLSGNGNLRAVSGSPSGRNKNAQDKNARPVHQLSV